MFKIRVPASSANLGPGFDCFGLALQLYLTVTATELPAGSGMQINLSGEGAQELPTDSSNLLVRTAELVAGGEGITLPDLHLVIDNQIPLERGLGSSAAAIVAGIALAEAVSGHELSMEKFFHYALLLESHSDNLAAARYGGFTIACTTTIGGHLVLKQPWPADLRVLVVVPDLHLDTESARIVLPKVYRRDDVVFNIQHALLLQAALAQGRYELIGEALIDRLHQPYRATLVPGLNEALTLRLPGLCGVALSGSGPTLLALVKENSEQIGASLRDIFAAHNIKAHMTFLEIDENGRSIARQ